MNLVVFTLFLCTLAIAILPLCVEGAVSFTNHANLRAEIRNVCFGNSTISDPIGTWDVSAIVDFSFAFSYNPAMEGGCTFPGETGEHNCCRDFNEDISGWDTSNANKREFMFYKARAFNQDITQWDTSKVATMLSMFNGAENFNKDIGTWNVTSVVNMRMMFHLAKKFNQDISGWNVTSEVDMSRMFDGASAFNQNLCLWGSKLLSVNPMTGLYGMFVNSGCPAPGDPVFGVSPVSPFCYTCSTPEPTTTPTQTPTGLR